MPLFLVQHGKNLPKDIDLEKGLSGEGKQEVEQVAASALKHKVSVRAIRHSGKKRALETAEIFARSLNPEDGVQKMEGLGPLDDVTKLDLQEEDSLMLVGHLPFMENLTSYLITRSSDREPVIKFQNGGIVCLERNPKADLWFIKWVLFPHID